MKKASLYAVLGLIILSQYVNCSNYASSTLDNDGHLQSSSTIEAYEGIRILNGDTFINCEEDHVQIGGTCNVADSQYNCLEVRMTRERNPVYWGTDTVTDNLGCNSGYRITCENGHFFAIIPKPKDLILSNVGETQMIEYQVKFQIYKSDDGLQYQQGEVSPAFNIYVQQNGACGLSQ